MKLLLTALIGALMAIVSPAQASTVTAAASPNFGLGTTFTTDAFHSDSTSY